MAGNPATMIDPDETDIDNDDRMIGRIDCGADEFDASVWTDQEQKGEIEVYPNPFEDFLFMRGIEFMGDLKFHLTNSAGDDLQCKLVRGGKLNLSNLPTGLYFLKVSSDKVSFCKVIVKI